MSKQINNPVWVKASERLQDPKISPYMICRIPGAPNYRYRFVVTHSEATGWDLNLEVDYPTLEWLDESPLSPFPTREEAEKEAQQYADKHFPFVWPKNKHGEEIRKTGPNPPNSKKHKREQEKIIAPFPACYDWLTSHAAPEKGDRVVKLLRELLVRTQRSFPVTEEELIWFEEETNVKLPHVAKFLLEVEKACGYNPEKEVIPAKVDSSPGAFRNPYNKKIVNTPAAPVEGKDVNDAAKKEADKWVFETNGHKWSNNDDSAGDNFGSYRSGFIAGAGWQGSNSSSGDAVEFAEFIAAGNYEYYHTEGKETLWNEVPDFHHGEDGPEQYTTSELYTLFINRDKK